METACKQTKSKLDHLPDQSEPEDLWEARIAVRKGSRRHTMISSTP